MITTFSTIFSTITYRLKYRIKKLCDFIKLGWNDYDYTYDSLLRLEKYKLSKMADRYELLAGNIDKPFLECWEIVRDLRLCVKLIDIVNGADNAYKVAYNHETHSYDKNGVKYVNMRNAYRFIPLKLQKLYDRTKLMRNVITNEVRRKKAWSLYSQIRTLNINRW